MRKTEHLLNIILFSALLLILPAASARAQTAPADGVRAVAMAEPELPTDEGKGAGSHHVFPAGWCTRYAADTYRDRTGRDVTWSGNAKDWGENASRKGFITSSDPNAIVRNAILVFGPTKSNSYGHVAIADEVIRGSYVVVSEQNWKGFGIVSRRTIKWADLRGRYGFTHAIVP